MLGNSHTPCIMTNMNDFYVRLCGCGVVHLCFGATTLNLSPETVIAVTETLKEISAELRHRLPIELPVETENVIRGHFPAKNES